ncbi:Hypothetical_protein [Hexamita inflata]|uniref:Hypothetical_protein n=1 Tax=Hexamita inflata TaxID=28002 RepID=A0AA86PKA5_9EUKA|nr:Hypothetical protein HINF_LOCUS24697 [Hexamita inflata]CAI9961429.1 Hypothetical protein HINF_LOCUS49074 [Hexamita inflata]
MKTVPYPSCITKALSLGISPILNKNPTLTKTSSDLNLFRNVNCITIIEDEIEDLINNIQNKTKEMQNQICRIEKLEVKAGKCQVALDKLQKYSENVNCK